MLAPERREKIMELIQQNKSVLVKELCDLFSVTSETIRKDLIYLEEQGKLLKTYGGAYIHEGVKNDLPTGIRETVLTEEKTNIGRACERLIADGDTISLDSSTTSWKIAEALKGNKQVTIVTNSLKVASLVSEDPHIQVVLAGGYLDKGTQAFIDAEAEEMIGRYYVDKAFVSCRGLDRVNGLTDGNLSQGRIRRLMLQQARKRFVVVDESKFNLTTFYKISDYDLVDKIVIDCIHDEEWIKFLEGKDIEIIQAMKITGA